MRPSTKFSFCFIVKHLSENTHLNLLSRTSCSTVEFICVDRHYVRGRLCQVVKQFYKLVICSSVAETCMATATTNVRLNYSVHPRICD